MSPAAATDSSSHPFSNKNNNTPPSPTGSTSNTPFLSSQSNYHHHDDDSDSIDEMMQDDSFADASPHTPEDQITRNVISSLGANAPTRMNRSRVTLPPPFTHSMDNNSSASSSTLTPTTTTTTTTASGSSRHHHDDPTTTNSPPSQPLPYWKQYLAAVRARPVLSVIFMKFKLLALLILLFSLLNVQILVLILSSSSFSKFWIPFAINMLGWTISILLLFIKLALYYRQVVKESQSSQSPSSQQNQWHRQLLREWMASQRQHHDTTTTTIATEDPQPSHIHPDDFSTEEPQVTIVQRDGDDSPTTVIAHDANESRLTRWRRRFSTWMSNVASPRQQRRRRMETVLRDLARPSEPEPHDEWLQSLWRRGGSRSSRRSPGIYIHSAARGDSMQALETRSILAQHFITHLRLSLNDGDFSEEDYETLLRLDETLSGRSPSGLRQLSASQMRRFPTYNLTATSSLLSERCSICMEDFLEEDKVMTLTCFHCFHAKCIQKWLTESSDKCPICMRRVLDESEQLQETSPIAAGYNADGESRGETLVDL